MRRSVFSLVAILTLVAGATAQDDSRMQRDIDALSSPPLAEEIRSLGENSPNAYVLFMQDYLKNIGSYGGAVNGQLTNETIRAIVGYCREAGFGETCIRGPLLPESIAAVSEAVAAALAPAVAEDPIVTAATPVAEAPVMTEEQPVAVAVVPALPEGWRLNDNGGRGTLGLSVDLVSAGPEEAVIRFSGTAAQSGYFNVELAPMQPALPGTWATSVEANVQRAADTGGKAWLRTAILSDDAYLGELFPGVPLEDAAVTHTGSGVPGDEVTRLLPYVQLWAEADEVIDVTITLSNPVFGRQ